MSTCVRVEEIDGPYGPFAIGERAIQRLWASGEVRGPMAATSGAINVRLNAREGKPEEAEGVATRPEPQLAHLASAVGLVWRSVVLWMLLLALLTLARLLG